MWHRFRHGVHGAGDSDAALPDRTIVDLYAWDESAGALIVAAIVRNDYQSERATFSLHFSTRIAHV